MNVTTTTTTTTSTTTRGTARTATFPAYYLGRPAGKYHRRYRRGTDASRGRA